MNVFERGFHRSNTDAMMLIMVNCINSLWVMIIFIFFGYCLKKHDNGSQEIIAEEKAEMAAKEFEDMKSRMT